MILRLFVLQGGIDPSADIAGIFSLPSALHAKPSVILNFSFFFPLICFVASPRSGGALNQTGSIDNQYLSQKNSLSIHDCRSIASSFCLLFGSRHNAYFPTKGYALCNMQYASIFPAN
jgi:hypothetical protein